ncbi:hypothetical protein DFA_09716 [Cavenderia fasciculata]|uniref:Uncharacterized protein n=1 Tax=Cavenderia fasciculata TaxID=261658 RepID=F4Q8E4_CACFS|nr:uncharacterized protein DFA_09716 [Cavenderia fasciculata]EGG16044.1 hypothetical protein DFA_09716 [Cavenderia fasciculata]|eukprot:XP_004352369.1 hypothetical protein DFA_09716 [Cavenderia fasciculata]
MASQISVLQGQVQTLMNRNGLPTSTTSTTSTTSSTSKPDPNPNIPTPQDVEYSLNSSAYLLLHQALYYYLENVLLPLVNDKRSKTSSDPYKWDEFVAIYQKDKDACSIAKNVHDFNLEGLFNQLHDKRVEFAHPTISSRTKPPPPAVDDNFFDRAYRFIKQSDLPATKRRAVKKMLCKAMDHFNMQ